MRVHVEVVMLMHHPGATPVESQLGGWAWTTLFASEQLRRYTPFEIQAVGLDLIVSDGAAFAVYLVSTYV